MADMTQAWCAPAFSTYGQSLGCYMTQWIYGDRQSNPFSEDRSKWPTTGRVAFLDRTVTFTSIAAAAAVGPPIVPTIATQQVNIGGGKNVIVFARQASVITAAAPAVGAAFSVLPNEDASYVNVQIQRQSGFIDVEDAPVNNNFGFGWSPNIRPVPELWLGNETRQITVSNFSNNAVKVVLTFTIALLDTGR